MSKRLIALGSVLTLLFTGIFGRIGYIIFSGAYTVSESYNSYVLTIDTQEPQLYYRNSERLTNNNYSYSAVIRPNSESLGDIHNLFTINEIKDITNELKEGYPIVKDIKPEVRDKGKYIDVFEVTSSDYQCRQLVSESSSGLLSYVDLPRGKKTVNFSVDAIGRLLAGDNGTVSETDYNSKKGLKLSIDKRVQSIVYESCEDMKSGCVIVMDTSDFSILAAITKPDDSFINKVFEECSVGSVFKIIVAACALENNLDYKYLCLGTTKVGDTTFSCQNNHIHGFENLKSALANSCNCYFVNLAQNLGADKLYRTAETFGFNKEIKIYDNWKITGSTLPHRSDLSSKGQLALLGFGQGKLTSTPLQICSSLCTIANGGVKLDERLVIGTVDEKGISTDVEYDNKYRVISENSADELLEYLRYVVTNGTAKNAETSNRKSAGKTATAQTGQYLYGNEILNTWFAGIYPYDNPKYAIVVMTENGTSGAGDCCPIFRTIVEKLENI